MSTHAPHHSRKRLASRAAYFAMLVFTALIAATHHAEAAASKKPKVNLKEAFPSEAASSTVITTTLTAAAANSTNMLLVILCTVLLTLLVVGTVVGVITTCVLVKLLRRSRVAARDDDAPFSFASPAHVHLAARGGGALSLEDEPLLQTVVQQYATASPAQRLQMAQRLMATTNSVSSSASHRSTAGEDRSYSGHSSSHTSPFVTVQGILSQQANESGTYGGVGTGAAAAAAAAASATMAGALMDGEDAPRDHSTAPMLLSTATAPPMGTSSADASVENTPGHGPQSAQRLDRSPFMIAAPAAVRHRLPASRAFPQGRTRDASGNVVSGGSERVSDVAAMNANSGAGGVEDAASQSSPVSPAFQPTSAKDEDVMNTTRESRYNLVRRIGDGAFSSVYLVNRKSDGRQFAMKYMVCLNDRERATALRECEIIHTVQGHPNVIQIADMFMSFQFQSVAGQQAAGFAHPTAVTTAAASSVANTMAVSAPNSPGFGAHHGSPMPSSGHSARAPPRPHASVPGARHSLTSLPMLPPAAQVTPTAAGHNVNANRDTAGTPTPPLSPTETIDTWLAALPPPAAAKAYAVLKAAEAAHATVNLTDMFRELAGATLVNAPVPIGAGPDSPSSVDGHHARYGGGQTAAWGGQGYVDDDDGGGRGIPLPNAATAFSAVDLEGFILSETDTERLMQQARFVRQHRARQARHITNQPPAPHQQTSSSPAPSAFTTTTTATTGVDRRRDSDHPSVASGRGSVSNNNNNTAAVSVDSTSVVTPYVELLQQVVSAQATSSGSSGHPGRGGATPLMSAAMPSSSAKSSPGLHSYRGSNRSAISGAGTASSLVDPVVAALPPIVQTCSLSHHHSPETQRSAPRRSPPPANVDEPAETGWWSPTAVADHSPVPTAVTTTTTTAAVPEVVVPSASHYVPRHVTPPYLATGSPTAGSYAPMTMVPSALNGSQGFGMPNYITSPLRMPVARDAGSCHDDSAVSSTDGQDEEPLQPVYRNAMLYAAAAGAAQQRRDAAGSSGGDSSQDGVPEPLATSPRLNQDGNFLTAATVLGGGASGVGVGAGSPVRYTGFANFGALQAANTANTARSPPAPSELTGGDASEQPQPQPQPQPSISYAPRAMAAMGAYAPVQYRNLAATTTTAAATTMHFSNFMTSAPSATGLSEMVRMGSTEAVGGTGGAAGTAFASVTHPLSDDDQEDVEDLDALARAPQHPLEVSEEATTVAEAIRLARAGQIGECMHTNDGKTHVAQAVLQRLPSYAPVSMAGPMLNSNASGFYGAAGSSVPGLRAPNMPVLSSGVPTASSAANLPDMFNGPTNAPGRLADRTSPSTAAAVSALKATTTATNVTSTVTTTTLVRGVASGPTAAGSVSRTASSTLFSPVYVPSGVGSPTLDTNSSRHTGHSSHSVHHRHHPHHFPSLSQQQQQQQQQQQRLTPSPGSSMSSSMMTASAPATVAARHGGYLCLVMEFHPMGDLSRYVLRNQQVLETAARRHQQLAMRNTMSNSNSATSVGAVATAATAGRSASPQGFVHRTPSPTGSASVASNTHSLFFEPRPASVPNTVSDAASTQPKAPTAAAAATTTAAATLAMRTRSPGLTTTGTSVTLNSSNHTLSSVRSTSLVTGECVDGRHPTTTADGVAVPRAVSYEMLLGVSNTDPTALNPLSEAQLLSIAYQLASVLRHLHTQNPPIVHRDLKPENILIKGNPRDLLAEVLDVSQAAAIISSRSAARDNNNNRRPEAEDDEEEVIDLDAGDQEGAGNVPFSPTSARSYSPHSPMSASSQSGGAASAGADRRTLANTRTLQKIIPIVVTDFGLSMVQETGGHGKRAGRGGGTRPYIAPEAWKGLTSTASDIWGYGCVLYALATGRLTARTVRIMSDEARHEGFASVILNDILSRRYSLAFASFVVSLLVVDPAKRPTAAMAERCFRVTEDEIRFDASSPFFSNVLDL